MKQIYNNITLYYKRKIKYFIKLYKKKFKNIPRNKFEAVIKYILSKKYRRIVNYTSKYEKNKINYNYILYQSFNGERMCGNPLAMFKNLISNSEYADYTHIWVLNDKRKCRREYKKLKNVRFVKIHSKEYFKYLTNSKYLINNSTFPTYFIRKEEQIYLNTWHGTPLKSLGRDMKGSKGQYKNIQRNMLQATHLINPNKYTMDIMLKSHDIDGIYSGSALDCGYPRADLTINCDKNKLRKELKIAEDKKVILYAPTWRGEVGNVENNIYKLIDDFKKIQTESTDYVVLFRVHPLVMKYMKKSEIKKYIVPEYIDTNELLSIVDVLITDYSSIMFDYLITNKPMLFYINDIKEFSKSRGYYLSVEDLPGKTCLTIEELIESIKDIENISRAYKESYNKYLEKYCYNDDGNATNRVVDMIFNRDSNRNSIKKDCKKNILMYCGGFLNNGITSSAINLLNNIDYEKFNVVIVENGKKNDIRDNNILKINRQVKIVFRTGRMNVTTKEDVIKSKFLNNDISIYEYEEKIREIYNREQKRLFGDVNFDVVIDFSGYVKYWSTLFAFSMHGKKIIYQHNDMLAEYYKIIEGKYKHKDNLDTIFSLYKYYDAIINVSEEVKEVNMKNLSTIDPSLKGKFYCVNNSINYEEILKLRDEHIVNNNIGLENYFKQDGKIKFLFVGRLSPEKDPKKLIDAFYEISKENSELYLYLLGDGVLREELKLLVNKLGIDNRVIFLGQVSNPFPIIDKCDCVISSSIYEGQPMILLESLVLRKKVIATNIAGNKSILKNGYGYLVQNSKEGLYKGMKKLVEEDIKVKDFDYVKYNQDALKMFYQNVCK